MASCSPRSWQIVIATALSLSVGWGIRGNFGHESGAMIPGALAACMVALLSGRDDWRRRVAYFAFFGALGWSFGGSMSYMQVIAYTHSGHSASVAYGFACLFVIGFLWAAVGGAGTALPALLDRERLTEFFPPLSAVFGAWWVQLWVERLLSTHSPAFRHEDPLYWFDTDWLGALVAIGAVLALALVRRRLDAASQLILWMGLGWWAGFLLLVNLLGWRMTPPRGDNWAGCVGMVAGMLLYFHRNGLRGAVLASVVSGLIGGFGFATATFLKLMEVTSGWETNWHSVLEQTYGLINGAGIAAAMLLLRTRAPRLTEDPPARRWTEPYAVGFVLLLVTYANFRKSAERWVEVKAMPEVMYGLPAWVWFNIGYGALAAAVLYLLFRHQRRPLALVPGTWLGRGQLLFVTLLWWVAAGNLERVLPTFTPERLVTEGVIHLNAVLCTLIALVWPQPEGVVEPIASAKEFGPLLRRVALLGAAGLVVTVAGEWGIVRAVYGNRFAGHAKLHLRFGPNATTGEAPRPGLPHP
jgi:hypothetical protein